MKKLLLGLFLVFQVSVYADNYVIATKSTSLVLEAKKGERLNFIYYGKSPKNISEIYDSGIALWRDAYPTFGMNGGQENALQVIHPDGNMSLDLVYVSSSVVAKGDTETTTFTLQDKVYPFKVNLVFKAYKANDVIETWSEISHDEKKPVLLQKFASSYLPIRSGNHWITHLEGSFVNEAGVVEEQLTRGCKVLKNMDGIRNTHTSNPSFMIALDGKPSETVGDVIAGSLAWSGNYKISLDKNESNLLEIISGINETASQYSLAPKEVFSTPEMILTYSTEGKGGASRNLHKWARESKIINGTVSKDILLNSWEGVYFNVNQQNMNEMMRDFASIGGELFVMDDGWFGNKYQRNGGESSLGDWDVCVKKLPGGINGLLECAKNNKIKFGLWIEPEMTNSVSELYDKHPEWILRQTNREPSKGRGNTQLVLDLTNPKVQDFVFGVVDKLMISHQNIAYMKWDANMSLVNYGSQYLPKDKQSHLYVEFHRGLRKVLERIRSKYPNLVLQACASGGGRVNYGLLPYFDEAWTSDNTDAMQRLNIQWGTLCFYPSSIMASHVSASPNHQTGRVVPVKFRFDVAMMGRLGMEMQPKDLKEYETEYAKRAIATYKSIRPVVQQGDLYKLISPCDNSQFASLMYVASNKSRAVLFAYRTLYLKEQPSPRFILQGLDPDKSYVLNEIGNLKAGVSTISQEGKIISGKFLMTQGISLPLDKDYGSLVIELNEYKL